GGPLRLRRRPVVRSFRRLLRPARDQGPPRHALAPHTARRNASPARPVAGLGSPPQPSQGRCV
ncbi:MAG: hypothetical protein AVDCRST_MAG15-2716, partial [uncultured Rubellimicrobium sp.]